MGAFGNEGEEFVKWHKTLSQGQVISFFRMIVVEVDADDAGGKAAEVLGVIDVTQPVLGGPVTKIMPISEGGGGEAIEDHLPEIIGGDFPGILAALKAKAKAQGGGLFANPQEDFLHPGPSLLKGFFMLTNGVELMLHKKAGTDLAGQGDPLERIDQAAWAGGSDVENHKAGTNGCGAFQCLEGVPLGEAPGGGAGIREFVSVGVRAEDLNGDGTKIVEDLDFWGPTGFVGRQNPRPKGVTGVVAEFDLGKPHLGGLGQQGRTIGASFRMPASRESQIDVGHL